MDGHSSGIGRQRAGEARCLSLARPGSIRELERGGITGGHARFTGLSHKPEKHRDLAPDLHLAVDVSDVGLDSPGPDLQVPGNGAVSQSSTDPIGNLKLAGRQVIPPLQIGPLSVVEKHESGISGPGTPSSGGTWFGI